MDWIYRFGTCCLCIRQSGNASVDLRFRYKDFEKVLLSCATAEEAAELVAGGSTGLFVIDCLDPRPESLAMWSPDPAGVGFAERDLTPQDQPAANR